MLLINEIRDPCCCKYLLCKIAILLQITCDHGDLTVTAALFPYKSGDPAGSFFHFLLRVHCREHTNLILCFFIYIFSVTENIFFKEMEGRCLGKAGFSHILQKNRRLDLPGQLRKPVDHLTAHIKKLIRFSSHAQILIRIHGHRYHHLFTDSKKFSHNTHLNRSKTGVTIQKKYTVFHFFRKRKSFFQRIHYFFSRHIMILQISGKCLVKNSYVFQLHLK